MQRVTFNNADFSMYTTRPTDEGILHFSLEGLLLPDQTLALNVLLGTLSLLANDEKFSYPRMIEQQQFTDSELSLLHPLLNSFPHYCPYEVLLASFNHRMVTETTIDRCRERLHEAMEEGIWDQEMRPVRNVLSRTRFKLRSFGIEIASILETGYVLMVLPKRKRLAS